MIKKFFSLFMIILFIANISQTSVNAEEADYQKFGRIAIAVVKEEYPGQDVAEYQYLGRKKATETKRIDTFRFEVMENDKQVFVQVRVLHDIKDKHQISISLEEKEK